MKKHDGTKETDSSKPLATLSREGLGALINEAAQHTGVVGSQASIGIGDEVIDLSQGMANSDSGQAMTVSTIGPIGSVTKLFNAAMVVSLAQDGVLSLDHPIAGYAPELRLADGAQHEITLRQLLSMSAGLDNGPYSVRGGGEDSLSDYVRSLHDLPSLYRPGAGFGYSNAGSCLAGFVAQRAAGAPWKQLLRTRVLLPCGLNEWALGADELPFHLASVGHLPTDANAGGPTVLRPWGHSNAQAPAGSSLAMSARNLARFGLLMARCGRIDHLPGLPAATVACMTTPTSTVPNPIPSLGIGHAWGLGPSLSDWSGRAVWSHSGGVRSARTLLCWSPSTQGVLAVTVNTPARFEAFVARILDSVGVAVFGGIPTRRRLPQTEHVQSAGLERFAGIYSRFGTRYEVSLRDGRLRYRETNLGVALPDEVTGVMVDCDCVSVADDQFLIVVPGFEEPLPISFAGKTTSGRAKTLVSLLFPARRVEVEDSAFATA